MKQLKQLLIFSIIFMCTTNTKLINDNSLKIPQLKLSVKIDQSYTIINPDNFLTILESKIKSEPYLEGVFLMFKNGKLPVLFYVKDINDSQSSNILINQMDGYSKLEKSLIPKIKETLKKVNTYNWNKISIMQTKKGIKCVQLADYIDKLNQKHTNVTYWLDDEFHRRWVSFSFNNVPSTKINAIINSVSFY
jgi:hypothetical protein